MYMEMLGMVKGTGARIAPEPGCRMATLGRLYLPAG